QRSNDSDDMGIDNCQREPFEGFQFAQEIQFGNSWGHTSVCQANRVRNKPRGTLVYGKVDAWLQKISYRNEDLQSSGGGIFAFDEINPKDCLAYIGFAF